MSEATMEFARERVLDFLGFEEGDCFDTNEHTENVRFTTQFDALEHMLEESELAFVGSQGNVRQYLRDTSLYLHVSAFKRQGLSNVYRDDASEWLVEVTRERFSEEYGDQDGDDRLSDDDVVEFKRRMRELHDWYLSRVHVFLVDYLRSWTFDKDDLLELVQQLRPSWVEKP